MQLTNEEKELIKNLLKKELEQIQKEEKSIIDKPIKMVESEVKYDVLLKNLIKKLE
jgi:hypothetical protein